MPKNPLPRTRGLDIIRDFMALPGMADLDYFVCGSIRRGREEVGDIDIIVVGAFPAHGPTDKYKESGALKARTYMYKRAQINMWTAQPDSIGSFILYATGSGTFNRYLRTRAIHKNMKLSQQGLFNRTTGKLIARETEKEIFNAMGYKYIPPHDRTTRRINAVLKAYKLRSESDRSHVDRLIGRVEDPARYPLAVQGFLPLTGDFILPSIVKVAPHLNKFLGKA